MPVLILARHAKAEAEGPTDFERSLNPTGLAQAIEAGAEIAERWSPDVAIASAARRTVQTGQAVVEAVNRVTGDDSDADADADSVGGLELRQDASLYQGGVEDWLDAINSIPAESDCAYIVGHQPTVAEVVGHLSPATGVPEEFRPSSIAVFDLESWNVEPGDYPAPEIRVFRGV
ncbi:MULTISPECIES: histidine phosphatase family protein [unclassified Brevibacterium]|uniref:SixA phosphatase family protein n=1 Tax=unclassified Brevibacterium TaxID=2614124 RepID=UPI001E30B9B1|nr:MULTISPECIES: histidine phosphatase family protein [unclassified Brevibacterium]MCD1284917.1 phosphohistidine phosphatase [Brevibacterium sp. CCUG 69071]MDK8435461.1 histidine phosphatase family protein [Brevibacterium sp. H-BE7]